MKVTDFDMLCILGPTAIGKTRLAVALAAEFDGEIISADSRQVYRRMDIGTGKDLDEYHVDNRDIPYHLVNIVEPGNEFNVFEYQRAFRAAYTAIRAIDRLPILCGGTGLYLDAVLSGYRLVEVPRDEALRQTLAGETNKQLVKRLTALRPLHNTTDTINRDRLVRAIEIATHSREKITDTAPFPLVGATVFGLRLDRAILKQRITARLKQRLEQGMIEEIENLLQEGLTPEQLDFYGLEYRFVTHYVTGRLNRNDMCQKLGSAIYQFARRQEKWFRRMERHGTQITWLDAQLPVRKLVQMIAAHLRICRMGNGEIDPSSFPDI